MLEQPSTDQARQAQRLRRRMRWVAALGLACMLLASHWVWATIAALLTCFLTFALDDEAQSLEQDR